MGHCKHVWLRVGQTVRKGDSYVFVWHKESFSLLQQTSPTITGVRRT